MNGEAQGAVPSKKYSVNDFSQKGDIMEYNDRDQVIPLQSNM